MDPDIWPTALMGKKTKGCWLDHRRASSCAQRPSQIDDFQTQTFKHNIACPGDSSKTGLYDSVSGGKDTDTCSMGLHWIVVAGFSVLTQYWTDFDALSLVWKVWTQK